MKEGIPLGSIERLLRRLRMCKEMQNDELLYILQQISKYLQDYDSAVKLAFLIPNEREGILCIAVGLFNGREDIQKATVQVLKKLEQTRAGKQLTCQMNYFYQFRYNSLQNQFNMLLL